MATVRMVSWNVQVYGAKKWGRSPNGDRLLILLAQLLEATRPNLIVTMELMSSVAEGISFNFTEALSRVTGGPWAYAALAAQPNGDREAYGFHWRTDAEFQPLAPPGAPQLSADLFPNNFSLSHGRKAAYMTFQSMDTEQLFTALVYHAPPNAFAVAGLAPIARTPQLYRAGPMGERPVLGRLIAGDFNLDINVQPEYAWLTNPVPAVPPPAREGEGAGCTFAVRRDTHLIGFRRATRWWGAFEGGGWSGTSTDYRSPLAIDNIFYFPFAGGASAIVDVPYLIATDPRVQRTIEGFDLQEGRAFPHAELFPNLRVATLAEMRFAYVFARYAVSDHLPVFRSVPI